MSAQMGFDSATATIAASGNLSGAVSLGAGRVRGLFIPSGWTTAVVTFLVSIDGTNYFELTDPRTNGYAASSGYTAPAGQYVVVDPTLFDGIVSLKIRSGTSGSPVTQSSQAVITIAQRLV